MILLVLSQIIVTYAQQSSYDENVARNIMMPLSAAAYASDPQPCLRTIDAAATMVLNITVDCGATNTCSGYIAFLPFRNAIAIGFR
ncbi:unnamed protein product [Strongylus vulgaris]|uniref:Uncharacterized protein n=1 Tax=Strongylus vulgaris TaxID=40348 RepID=A0A3P7L6Q9_STRVU|nr:unnamed protein product [Strongylus vulgaris]